MNISQEQVKNFLEKIERFFNDNDAKDEILLSAVNKALSNLKEQLKKGLFNRNYELLTMVQKIQKQINIDIPPQPLPCRRISQEDIDKLMIDTISFNAEMKELSSQYHYENFTSNKGFLSDIKRFAKKRLHSWHLITRGLGLVQCIGGASQSVAGVVGEVASFETGVGPVLAAAFSTMGVDNAVAGCFAAWTGEYKKTEMNKGLHSLGLSDVGSDIVEVIANLGFFWGPTLFEGALNSSKNIYLGRKVSIGIDYSNKLALSFIKNPENQTLRKTFHIREKKIVSLKKFGIDESKIIRSIAAENIREARRILIRAKVSRRYRNDIIRSFDLETFRVREVLKSEIMYRTFDDGDAKLIGRYVTTSVLQQQIDRIIKLALPNNSATRFAEVHVSKDSVVFEGKVSSQAHLTPGLTGGENQVFLTGPIEQYSFNEIFAAKAVENMKLRMR